ncbi:MAG: KOW domain-containing RNA-binding protein [Clostridia bacterium]
MKSEFKVGSVVYSMAGRDSNNFFMVTEIVDDNYVKIVDGDVRKLEKPKLKKIKHLKSNGDILSNIAIKILEKKQVFDKEIRSALRVYNEKQ